MIGQRVLMVLGVLVICGSAWAGRPLITNDAEAVEYKRFQWEAALFYGNDESTHHFDLPLALSYGILPDLEIGIGCGAQHEHRHDALGDREYEVGVADLAAGFKWKFMDEERMFLSQALAGAIKIPTADHDRDLGSGEVDYDLTWIMTRQLTERATVLFNLGYTWVGGGRDEDASDVLHYGPALTYQLTPRLQPVVEIVLETPVDGGNTSAGILGGVRYQLLESLTLDGAIGTQLAGDWPDWTAAIGFTWVP